MFTARALLRASKIRSDGRAPLTLVVTASRKRAYLATGLHLRPAEWDESKARAKGRSETAARINRRVSELLMLCEQEGTRLITNGHAVTAVAIRKRLPPTFGPTGTSRGGTGCRSAGLLRSLVDGYRDRGQEWSYQKQSVVLGKMRASAPARPLSAAARSDARLVRAWYDWLRAAPPRARETAPTPPPTTSDACARGAARPSTTN